MKVLVNESKVTIPLSEMIFSLELVGNFPHVVEVSNGCYNGCLLIENNSTYPARFKDTVRFLLMLEPMTKYILLRTVTFGWSISESTKII